MLHSITISLPTSALCSSHDKIHGSMIYSDLICRTLGCIACEFSAVFNCRTGRRFDYEVISSITSMVLYDAVRSCFVRTIDEYIAFGFGELTTWEMICGQVVLRRRMIFTSELNT